MPPSPLRDHAPGSGISRIVRLADHRDKDQSEAGGERRIHARRVAGELPWLNMIRLKYGPTLSLLDLSSGGIQIDLEDFSLRPGSTVVIEIVGHESQFIVPSRVLRCEVSSVAPSIKYRGALEFKRVLDLPDVSSIDRTNDDMNPLHAHGGLALDLGRLDSPLAGEARILSPHAATRDSLSAADRTGWNKIVVRYGDGRMLKGYCQDFDPPRGHFPLWPAPTAPAASCISVPIGSLKAVFFVRDFAGDPRYKEDTAIEPSGGGRKVAITFLDDELLVGTTLNYRPDEVGFLVRPNDPKSNNIRAFVFSRAVRHVRFV
jgi:hypothetical protein